VTGVTLGPPLFTSWEAVPVFLLMTFDTRYETPGFHGSMGIILDVAMAVEAGEGFPVSRALEILDVNLKGALYAALPVTTNAVLGGVCPKVIYRRTTDKQRTPNEGDNYPAEAL
jgi:hypothetical protein